MNRRTRRGLSRYRAWCGEAAINPDRLEAYIAHLNATVAPMTAIEYLWGLRRALQEQEPGADLVWMERRLRQVWRASPARPCRNGPGLGAGSAGRRRRLLVDEWPAFMREAWRAARTSTDAGESMLDEVEGQVFLNDAAVSWSPDTIDQRERAMGAYLRHLADEGLPLSVNSTGIESYTAAMKARGLSPKSISTRIIGILRLSEVMWPHQRWRWLQYRAYGLCRQAKRLPGVRTPAAQYIPLKDLRAHGRKLMQQARMMPKGRRAAAQFQVGLILNFLTHHPVRRRNATRMEVIGLGFGTAESEETGQLKLTDEGIICTWPRTKTRPRAERLAQPLVAPMLEWLHVWRPCLAGPESGHALWLSNAPGNIGKPLTEGGLSEVIGRVTASEFGIPIGPHAFRYIVATTIADFLPEEVGVISTLLGHRDAKSLRPYVRAAKSGAAARLFERIVQARTSLDTPDLSFLPRRRFRIGRASGR